MIDLPYSNQARLKGLERQIERTNRRLTTLKAEKTEIEALDRAAKSTF